MFKVDEFGNISVKDTSETLKGKYVVTREGNLIVEKDKPNVTVKDVNEQ
ncbi:hypothetical protein ACK3Z9_03340 [Aeromonas caviae]